MLESKRAGYRTPERCSNEGPPGLSVDTFAGVIRVILAICFLAVLGLEIWLLVSALGGG